jgi:hypothetical protein
VLASWIGRGGLVPALQAVHPDELPRDWTASDTRLRVDYVLFLTLLPTIGRWPTRVTAWLDLLPAQSLSLKNITKAPTGGTSWPQTRRRFGWPPSDFVNRSRLRVADELLSTTLAWVVREVIRLRAAAEAVDPLAAVRVSPQLQAAVQLLDGLLAGSPSVEPTPAELVAIEREGGVWRSVAAAARQLRQAQEPADLASRLLLPELQPLLFHLGVLGVLLLAIRDEGGEVVSRSPLGHVSGQEQYHVRLPGRSWHLWVEGAGAWHRYKIKSPYRQVTSFLPDRTRVLSPDILLLRPGKEALVLECKYSGNSDYVGRRGLAQVNLYATELHGSLSSHVTAYVIPPETVLTGASAVATPSGSLGLARPSDLPQILKTFFH